MARPREFDVDKTMDRVLSTFWEHGYEATSVDDICDASGLSKSSLYATFGDKRDLLLRSLERYIDIPIGHIRELLAGPEPVLEKLERLARQIIEDVVAGPGRRGCFIGNCAAELPRDDPEAMALVRRGMQTMEGLFRDSLLLTSGGTVPTKADADAIARFLVAGFQGLRIVGKNNPDREVLMDIVNVMLRCVA